MPRNNRTGKFSHKEYTAASRKERGLFDKLLNGQPRSTGESKRAVAAHRRQSRSVMSVLGIKPKARRRAG